MDEEFNMEIIEVKKLYKSKRYFEVIFIGTQLLDRIASHITSVTSELGDEADQKGLSHEEYKGWKEVKRIYLRRLRNIKGEEAVTARILEVIYELVNCTGFEFLAKKKVVSLMHKVEEVVSFRNILAHDYHEQKKEKIKRSLPVRSRQCIELISELIAYPLI